MATHDAYRPARVLIVDDDLDVGFTLGRLLALLGANVQRVSDPRREATLAQWFHPDIVLLDLRMPELDGFAVALALRLLDVPRSRVVALANQADADFQSRVGFDGFDGFLVKPVEISTLKSLIGEPRSAGKPRGLPNAI